MQRPQDLVFTLFGDYLLHRKSPVWVGSLIRLLQPLGVSEPASRTVLSRMVGKGWLESEREGRRSFYDLTRAGRRLLETGKERIYHPDWDKPWDGSWYLLAYSVPEDERQLRGRVRDRLAWLGFGSLGNGLWISPHDVEAEVEEMAAALQVGDYLACFRATGAAFSEPARLVEKCWDLSAINGRYEAFIERHVPEFTSYRDSLDGGDGSDEESYVLRFRLVHEYRDFPRIDPYLPRSLLPPNWGGECAAHLFNTYHDLLSTPADRYVESVLEEAPERAVPVGGGTA
ncbi:MAG: phenylacetic acid degradation operon negative regulatory protein PaaX [Gemmatimonadota bacterium]|nr:phenylacetic acid degradation operon negative regulatory protein PaaX [Gemmatimonadota bacterium]